MGRRPCCAKEGLNKGAWTANEDQILKNYITIHGEGKWRDLPQKAGLKRCGKSCRLRWLNYLRPDIKRGNISIEEEELIIRLHKLLGNRWSLIAGRLPGRTDNEIKNYWNTNLSKRMQGQKRNISPNTPQVSSHNVIRTKAVKCTKAVNVDTLDPKSETLVNSPSETPSSSAINEDNTNNNSMDFLVDFDIDELLAFEYNPIPELYRTQNGGDKMGNNVADNGEYSHGTDFCQACEHLDLRGLESYLNLEDEWIN
ncbi:hypothetical protein CXB51_018707 [Gossypium anomalum]|uniref:Myb-related protein 123 n=1 Tax=Gossypium anomalum TaxID=47600 RepID=A0A8J5YYF6_9ROSI|nr:hypothetical protein CXB51_018707 [Gossypium anomalum]